MIELADTSPACAFRADEYKRLLGYPREQALEGRAAELAAWAQDWYARNGRPWVYAREEDLEIVKSFSARRLRRMLESAEAHRVILAAVSAGPEIESEAQKRWQEQKPDEYFFLEALGSAVVEHLTTMTGSQLCDWAEKQGMAVLPHDSPGYPEWDLREQAALLELMRKGPQSSLLSRLEVLDSGALRPKKSLLAVFGLTRHTERLQRLTDLIPCQRCSFEPCQYRRSGPGNAGVSPASEQAGRLRSQGPNSKALRRWAAERLSLKTSEDGGIEALFRYEGTTCMNMGRPLTFHYEVKLGPRTDRYPIRDQRCVPAGNGHTFMCAYLDHREQLMAAVASEKPLLGRRLEEVLSWPRPAFAPGCYCEPASRQHKWGLVLETIHYALSQKS